MGAAARAGVRLQTGCGLRGLARAPGDPKGRFAALLSTGEEVLADRVLIATGGTRGSAGLSLAASLGHTVIPTVPSLFTFHVDDPRLKGLEGVAAAAAGACVPAMRLRESGPILVTHWGLSGPAILTLLVNWAEPRTADQARAALEAVRLAHPRRQVSTANPLGIPARLWERLVAAAGVAPLATWAGVPNGALRALALQATASEFAVAGKSMNKEEFVTCGGVSLAEVDMATMESRLCPGLHFAGEVLDIDGITGGYNFQAAWTTGWQAGRAMAAG
jgi:predicted Rossmann fold flavoprotein